MVTSKSRKDLAMTVPEVKSLNKKKTEPAPPITIRKLHDLRQGDLEMSGTVWKLFTRSLFAKRKNEFVFAEPFLKINSAYSLQSTFARIVPENAKQTE